MHVILDFSLLKYSVQLVSGVPTGGEGLRLISSGGVLMRVQFRLLGLKLPTESLLNGTGAHVAVVAGRRLFFYLYGSVLVCHRDFNSPNGR